MKIISEKFKKWYKKLSDDFNYVIDSCASSELKLNIIDILILLSIVIIPAGIGICIIDPLILLLKTLPGSTIWAVYAYSLFALIHAAFIVMPLGIKYLYYKTTRSIKKKESNECKEKTSFFKRKKKKSAAEKFLDQVYENTDKDYGICPPPTPAQEGLDVLIEHFLGKDWYVVLPLGAEQVNTEAIYEILKKYPNPKR